MPEIQTPTEPQWLLVVEDDIRLCRLVRDVLEFADYRARIAVDGLDALAILRNSTTPPALIVSDVQMPRLDGIELLKHLRSEARWESIPVIFLSGIDQLLAWGYSDEVKADAYLAKPFDLAELLFTIRELLIARETASVTDYATTR